MSRTYTKSDSEQIVYMQLENLKAMHDLLNVSVRLIPYPYVIASYD